MTARTGRSKPTAELVTVTPTLAGEWLTKNHSNRPISDSTIRLYARDMRKGNWKVTGDGIRFSTDGTLLDGQHRLRAIVSENLPVQMWVFRNLPPDAQGVMDTGRKRSAANALHLEGAKNATVLAAAARLIALYELGHVNNWHAQTISYSDIRTCINLHPELLDAVRFAVDHRAHTELNPAVIAFSHWRLGKISAAAADEFLMAVCEQVGLEMGSPTKTLVDRLISARRSGEKLPAHVQTSMTFRAWNAWRAGRTLTQLKANSVRVEAGVPVSRPVDIPMPK